MWKGIVIVLAFIGMGFIVMYVIYNNSYTTVNNAYEAQIESNQAVHDEMWKILQQQAGVSSEYSKSFSDNYTRIMASRNYGGEMMKWITESNPNFDNKLYDKLMTSIEVYRTKFTMEQRKMIGLHNELKNKLTLFPSSFFLVTIGGHTLPELKLVTSSRTDAAFETGKDDDVNLFQKDTTKH